MPFFEGSSNFKITGGTFNVISGDLNQYETNHSVFTAHSFNGNPDGPNYLPNSGPYPPYGSQPYMRSGPPRGYGPAPGYHPLRRPPHHHQEHGPYGFADYYDNRSPPQESHYSGYDGLGGRSRFETAMHSPEHVEVAGGEFMAFPHGDIPRQDPRDSTDYSRSFMRVFSSSLTELDPVFNGSLNDQENVVVRDVSPFNNDNVTMSDATDMTLLSDEEGAGPLPNDFDPVPADSSSSAAQRPLTRVERMRMAMADMDIAGADQSQTVDASASTAPPAQASAFSHAEGRRKSRTGTFFRRGSRNP
ncbi:hypothetical protein DFH07DRAFT_937738 [Mycena maculata]|uniref:Uncharacterized protein n=1 Tax=Mycena maculata TaxID=230809 RepID=A0AAD7NRN2_9AGAR|nr:hypothetical protein DFH07DRAFT_937738 [Mycena maculata]